MKYATIKRVVVPSEMAYWEQEDLYEWYFEKAYKKLPRMTHAWYWYSAGAYEGMGYFLARTADASGHAQWYVTNMGHCSCDGPMDDDFTEIDPNNIKASGSAEWCEQVQPLLSAAKEDGHA